MKFSDRITRMPESPIRKLVPHAEEAKRRGISVYHLNIGQPDIQTPKQVLDAVKNISVDVIAYGPSEGLSSYREALPSYYRANGIDLSPSDILVTTAGSEALLFAVMAVCDDGDEVIVPEPYYANVNGFAGMAGVSLVPVRTSIEDGFALPEAKAFEAAVTERTRAIMICNPNNPTGAVYTREALEELAEIARKHDLFLIADEVYREFVYDGEVHTSLLTLPGTEELAIVVDSVSKRYSACGARIGALISRNHDLLAQVLKMAQARLCPPTIEQIAAEAAVTLDQEFFQQVTDEYTRRRDRVFSSLSSLPGVVCRKPRGAFYIMAKLPVASAEDFAVFMLRDFSVEGKTVMLAPAEGFYASPGAGRDEVRIAYVLNEHDLEDAMHILGKGLEAYGKRQQ